MEITLFFLGVYPSLIFCLHAIDLLAVRAKRKEPLHKIGWKLLKYYRHSCAVPTQWVEILFENIFLYPCVFKRYNHTITAIKMCKFLSKRSCVNENMISPSEIISTHCALCEQAGPLVQERIYLFGTPIFCNLSLKVFNTTSKGSLLQYFFEKLIFKCILIV